MEEKDKSVGYRTIITITGKDIEEVYASGQYSDFANKMKERKGFEKRNILTEIYLKDVDISDKPELAKGISDLLKEVSNVKIENSKIGNIQELFDQSFDKEVIRDESTEQIRQVEMKSFTYNKNTQNLTIDSGQLSLLNEYKKYFPAKNLKLELFSDAYKNDIIDNIDVLREHTKEDSNGNRNIAELSDATQGKTLNITDIRKHESYANGNIVLFKSDIIKETMGFDRLPTNAELGTRYNLKIDGNKLTKDGKHKLEGQELETFLKDIEEIAKYVPISGLSIKNVDIPENANLDRLSGAMETVDRIKIENSNIPNLKDIVNNIEDKSKLETIIIKNSGLKLEDVNVAEFQGLGILNIRNEEIQKNIITENSTQEMNQNQKQAEEQYLVEVKETWYQRAWNRAKAIADKILGRNQQKALPEEATNPDKLSNEGNKAKEFASSMQKGVNLDELDRVARESQEQSRAEQSRTKQDIELEDRE